MSLSALSPLSPDEHAVIARVVDDAPPLTETAKARLAALLRPADSRDGFLRGVRGTLGGAA